MTGFPAKVGVVLFQEIRSGSTKFSWLGPLSAASVTAEPDHLEACYLHITLVAEVRICMDRYGRRKSARCISEGDPGASLPAEKDMRNTSEPQRTDKDGA